MNRMNYKDMTYKDIEQYIEEIPKFTSKNDLQVTAAFLQKLGNPSIDKKIIHVAGTNGKGSVCAYLNTILLQAGYQVGMFTSPHLVTMRERFCLNGEIVSENDFATSFRKVMKEIISLPKDWNGYHPTFFEFLFFMGMILFEEKNMDYLILETGLGGRLDTTNVVPKKEVCVITEIGMDHMEYLGNTYAAIAAEKAGILRKSTPVVFVDKREAVTKVITEKAEELGAPYFAVKKEDICFCGNTKKDIDFSFQSRYYNYCRLSLHTMALYQMENAALAILTVEVLALKEKTTGQKITPKQIAKALYQTNWEGRMEEISPGLFIDGAHNEDGIQAFIETVSHMKCKGRKLLLFSVVKDKNHVEMIQKLMDSGCFSQVAVARLLSDRSVSEYEIKEEFARFTDRPLAFFGRVEDALDFLEKQKNEEDVIFAAGSLYLVGQLKELCQGRNKNDQF